MSIAAVTRGFGRTVAAPVREFFEHMQRIGDALAMEQMVQADEHQHRVGAIGLSPATVARMYRESGQGDRVLGDHLGVWRRGDDPFWTRYDAFLAKRRRGTLGEPVCYDANGNIIPCPADEPPTVCYDDDGNIQTCIPATGGAAPSIQTVQAAPDSGWMSPAEALQRGDAKWLAIYGAMGLGVVAGAGYLLGRSQK